MIIVGIRTDKPEAELWYRDTEASVEDSVRWQAHRALADTIHVQLQNLLEKNGAQLENIEGLIAFQGPGSFTGLRIGLTVANTVAYGLKIPIVGTDGDGWFAYGLERLVRGDDDQQVMPEYGAPVHITQQKK